jgi:hypothetical protein
MTPQERKRRAILWHRVERLLFFPVSAADKRTWCACFIRSLAPYWEIEPFAVTGSAFPGANFSVPLIDFSLSYDLSEWGNDLGRSSVRMIFKGVVFACHDIDHAYHDRGSLADTPPGGVLNRNHYPNRHTRSNDLMTDIRWVLDRFILHPCAHFHPMPEVLGYLGPAYEPFRDVLHEVRLGLGITNPFAALFQFRMNLLLGGTPHDTKTRKETERNRIADLVHDAILSGNAVQTVPPGRLFDLPR